MVFREITFTKSQSYSSLLLPSTPAMPIDNAEQGVDGSPPISLSTKDILKEKGKLVSDCMLEQYFGTAAGVGIGLAIGLQSRNVKPFLIIASAGSLMDYVHGYIGPCSSLIEDFNLAKLSAENDKRGK